MNMFGVLSGPSVSARVTRYPDGFALDGYEAGAIISGAPIEGSSLFSVDPLLRTNRLTDQKIKRHLRYLAPEVVSTRVMSAASDLFALGVVFYEVLTGTTIDGGPDTPDVMTIDVLQDFQRHVLLDVPPPDEVLAREAELGSYRVELPPSQLSAIIMKCIAKNTEDRYASVEALCYDLNRLRQVVRAHGDLSKFIVGEVDRLSRFALPAEVVYRSEETATLNNALKEAATLAGSGAWSSKGLTVYGQSGAGKTRVLLEWTRSLERQGDGRKYLLSYAKVDEHINRPLTSFTQLFDALLERVLTDGREEVETWRQRIHDLLGSQMDAFLRLLSPSSQRLLAPNRAVKRTDSIDVSAESPVFTRPVANLTVEQLPARFQKVSMINTSVRHWLMIGIDGAHGYFSYLVPSRDHWCLSSTIANGWRVVKSQCGEACWTAPTRSILCSWPHHTESSPISHLQNQRVCHLALLSYISSASPKKV
jgi:serine/threonine protein kinase